MADSVTTAATIANSAPATGTPFQQATSPANTASNGNFSSFEQARAAGTAQISTPLGTTYNAAPSASTTTISNANKINQVQGIQNTTNSLANTGISTDNNGNATYANGTTVPQPDTTPLTPTSKLSTSGVSQGGYIGDVYYAPGAPLPTGADGKPVQTTDTSPTNDQILQSLNDQKAQSDALTASIIDSIQSQYSQLIDQQKLTNQGQEATVNNSLLMGGVTGQGSSSQFAPISSAGIIQSQVSYGISQIADLQNKESQAIIAAKQAGQNADFQLMDKINTQISNIRDEKVTAANKLNDQIATQNQKLADEKIQQTKDSAVAQLFSSGVTDPAQILSTLKGQGLTISASEINTAIKALTPVDQANIQTLAAQAAAAGADAATVSKIANSSNFNDAINLATPALGADHADKLKQEAITNQQNAQRIAIEQENANINLEKLKADKAAASQSAANAAVTTPSGKVYIDGTNLDAAGKAAALANGQVVLSGDSAKAMTTITNVQGEVGSLLTSLQSKGAIDANGNFTGKGVQAGILDKSQTADFQTTLDSTIKNLQTLPGTGGLVATLQSNRLGKNESGSALKTKITNIVNALGNAENGLLASGSTLQDGAQGTINGQAVVFHNGQWETK